MPTKTKTKNATKKETNDGSTFTPVSQGAIDASIALVASAAAPIAGAPALTPDARKRALRVHTGGQQIAVLLAKIAEEQGLTLPGVSTADMTALMTHADRIRGLLRAVDGLGKRLRDEILRTEGAGWEMAQASYAALRGTAKKVAPGVATDLAEIERWFKKGVARRASPSAPAPTPTTAPPPPTPTPTPT